jgi:GNAT superfamily N-acetyltransferase
MITKPCTIKEIQPLIQEYIGELSSPIDSFLESQILGSAFYVVQKGETNIGCYAVQNDELLTLFYIRRPARKHAQEIFNQVLNQHQLRYLFVPTCDELFLSLALDKEITIRKQAYFFQDGKETIPMGDSLNDAVFQPAGIDDLQEIERICGDFLDNYKGLLEKKELFTYSRGSTLLGIGLYEESILLSGYASIGMFTNEAYRKQGIGKHIILNMKKWCYNHRLEPICGCGYDNEASKRTLESAGMVTKTRLLKIEVLPK